MEFPPQFTRQEALGMWSRLVAGWANSLDATCARTLIDGMPNEADASGCYEGVTRMLWGIGGWLSRPERSSIVEWHGRAFDLQALMRHSLLAGCDISSPGYWGRPASAHQSEYDQRTVETGQIAFTVWQTRERIWDHLHSAERASIVNFLDRFGQRPSIWRSNWALFWALNHASRKALGADFDQAIIDSVINEYMDAVYCGDGWYDDGAQRGGGHFDDYNYIVFAMHVLAWAECDGDTNSQRRDVLLDRVRETMVHFPDLFAANGGYSHFGRSLLYKFARLGAALSAYKHGVWPHSAGMLKRLVGRHLRWYFDRGGVRADGTLRQELTAGGSSDVIEYYGATGSSYWAMEAFSGLWGLADDDPFWSAPEEPLPVERSDFVKVYPQPGWVVAGVGGEVHRYNAGTAGAPPANYGAKYSKFVYSSQFPFNVGLSNGQYAPDNMLCLTDGQIMGHRMSNVAHAVGEAGWLRVIHTQDIGGMHTIDTIIVPLGEFHMRAHRITLDPATTTPIGAIEGCAPLGYSPGEVPEMTIEQNWQTATVTNRTETRSVGIRNVSGYDQPSLWQGDPSINSVYARYVQPVLQVNRVSSTHDLICIVYMGNGENVHNLHSIQIDAAEWRPDGSFHLKWDGAGEVVVPALR